jgi:chitin synthase
MNPGDLYNPNSPDRRDQYSGSRLPPSQSYPAQLPPPGRQPTFPPPNPYDQLSPMPTGPSSFPTSQSTPFPRSGPTPTPYADPFHDNNGPPPPGQWENPPGSRHYASYPALPVSPPPVSGPGQGQGQGYGIQGPRQSLPPNQGGQPLAMSPPRQNLPPPDMNIPRARFDSNVSYQSANSFPATSNSQPYGLSDNRLASPPPLLPHHSSASSVGYPPGPFPHSTPHQYSHQDDEMDNAPLLNHASADPRFGAPYPSGARSPAPARFQLQDGGDVGVMPNRWRHDSGLDGGSQNGQPYGYGLGGGHEPPPQDETNVRYGPLPTRVLRRNRTQKKVK